MRLQESFADENQPCLYVCSTPIGNLQDVTLRLLDTLRSADVIAAEDTRQTRKLLTRFEISPRELVSYHQHNEFSRQSELLSWWQQGKKVALVSDAGTPAISDPGFAAVKLAVNHGIRVIPIPGASASLTALVASGIVAQPFLFVGFLPRNNKLRLEMLKKYESVDSTLVFYESPHRLASTLNALTESYSRREIVLARELTKRYESFVRGTLQEVTDYVEEHESRGEFVIVVGPPDETQLSLSEETDENRRDNAIARVKESMENGMSHREAVALIANETGVRKRDLYQATLKLVP